MINISLKGTYVFRSNAEDSSSINLEEIKTRLETFLRSDIKHLLREYDLDVMVNMTPINYNGYIYTGYVDTDLKTHVHIDNLNEELGGFSFTYGDVVEDGVDETDSIYWNCDIFGFMTMSTLRESKNSRLDKMYKSNKVRGKDKGWFVKLDTGNVPLNKSVFNSEVGITESMNNKIYLEYFNLPYNDYFDVSQEDRPYLRQYYVYKADEATVKDILANEVAYWDEFDYESDSRDEDIDKYVEEHFDELVETYNDKLLKYFEEEAVTEAWNEYVPYHPNLEYDYEYDDVYENMENVSVKHSTHDDNLNKVTNIREELNKIDSKTYCEYDLLNSYNAIKWTEDSMSKLVEKLSKHAPPGDINRLFESLMNCNDKGWL